MIVERAAAAAFTAAFESEEELQNEHRTNLDGSTLWQLALLELWLQANLAG